MSPAPHAASPSTPLWMISIFIGLSETTAALVATQAEGWIADAFAVFALAYPAAVTAIFFYVLIRRNWILYPPSEFSADVQPGTYVEAMRVFSRTTQLAVESAITAAVETSLTATAANGGETERREYVISQATEAAEEVIASSSVHINLEPLESSLAGHRLQVLVDEDTTVFGLLDQLAYEIRDHVGSFTYGVEWVLKDEFSRKLYKDMGTFWAQHQGRKRDWRRLSDVGIRPGDRLAIERISSRA